MRRLSADELEAVASELGATVTGDVAQLEEVQQVDAVVEALASLLVAIVRHRPFDRRNHAVAVASIDLLARLNRQTLDLAPPEEVATLIAGIRDGLSTGGVRDWLAGRLAADVAPTAAPPSCPACWMPLREALAGLHVGRTSLPFCGGCGHVLTPPIRPRSRQEV